MLIYINIIPYICTTVFIWLWNVLIWQNYIVAYIFTTTRCTVSPHAVQKYQHHTTYIRIFVSQSRKRIKRQCQKYTSHLHRFHVLYNMRLHKDKWNDIIKYNIKRLRWLVRTHFEFDFQSTKCFVWCQFWLSRSVCGEGGKASTTL